MRFFVHMIFSAALVASLAGSSVFAQSSDNRIVETSYQADAVYSITIKPGHATVVEFELNELVESVALGDNENWLVETTSSGNRIVVKPGTSASFTNMVVMTTQRTYAFTLTPFGEQETFVLRFTYDNAALPSASYRMRGARSLLPEEMTDNGRVTTILWAAGADLPAVFVVDDEDQEVIPSYRPVGAGLLVEGVFDRYVFRAGRRKATASRRPELGEE